MDILIYYLVWNILFVFNLLFWSLQVDTTILGLDDEKAKEMPFIASMGIYVISKDVMLQLLREKFPGANDFGSEVIPGATNIGMRVCLNYHSFISSQHYKMRLLLLLCLNISLI